MLDALASLCDFTSLSVECRDRYSWGLFSISALHTIEIHPEWKASIRCLLICSLLAIPNRDEQAMEYFTACVEEHLNSTCKLPYESLHKLQSALTQLCSDYYNANNFSLCAVVSIICANHSQWCKRSLQLEFPDSTRCELLTLWAYCQLRLHDYVYSCSFLHFKQSALQHIQEAIAINPTEKVE